MSDFLTDALVIPALLLALTGWLVPKLLSLVFPEGVKPLVALSFASVLIMFCLSACAFLGLYMMQGIPFSVLFEGDVSGGIYHFGQLGLMSALLWGPIMVLSIAGLPKTWVEETW